MSWAQKCGDGVHMISSVKSSAQHNFTITLYHLYTFTTVQVVKLSYSNSATDDVYTAYSFIVFEHVPCVWIQEEKCVCL